MNISKRCSVSSKHQQSVCSTDLQPSLDLERITRYLQFIKISLRNHLKDKQYLLDEIQLKELHKLTKLIQQYFLSNKENTDHSLSSAKDALDKYKLEREQEVRKITADTAEKLRLQESEFNRKLLSMKNEFGRKEQTYKEIIENAMRSLSNARTVFQTNQTKLNNQVQGLQKCLTKLLQNSKNNSGIETAIHEIVEQIQLRQEHSLIALKQDEISIDEIDISDHKIGKRILHEDSLLHEEVHSLQAQMQDWITKLICFGLFQKENEECIKKLMALSVGSDYAKFLDSNMYPILLEILVNNMRRNEEAGLKYLQGAAGGECEEEVSLVELRNINSIAELSINDSQMEEMNFKKKDRN